MQGPKRREEGEGMITLYSREKDNYNPCFPKAYSPAKLHLTFTSKNLGPPFEMRIEMPNVYTFILGISWKALFEAVRIRNCQRGNKPWKEIPEWAMLEKEREEDVGIKKSVGLRSDQSN